MSTQTKLSLAMEISRQWRREDELWALAHAARTQGEADALGEKAQAQSKKVQLLIRELYRRFPR